MDALNEQGAEPEASEEATHVCVAVRCRPLSGVELLKSDSTVVELPSETQLLLKHRGEDVSYTCDHVFGSDASQEKIFQTLGVPQLDKAFDGYNSTIFAYGETGSGKTHTMANHSGGSDNRGLIPRIGEGLFNRIATFTEEHKTRRFLVLCTFLEIYNEVIYDLLAPPGKQSKRGGLEVKEQKGIGIYVKDLTEVVVEDASSLWKCLELGLNNRATSATKMNNASSRSHCVFTIRLHMKDSDDSTKSTVSKINLVDLAGSERVKSSETEGTRLTEGVNINKSLSALGNVINALSSMASRGKKNLLVPYRDSKLTRVLQESFGGNSLCTMIATISSSATAVDETVATMSFAKRAKAVRVLATRNDEGAKVKRLEEEVLALRQAGSVEASEGVELKDKEELDEERRAQIETLEAFMQQSWEDKQRLSQQYEEERKRAAEDAQSAAEQVLAERQRRIQMLKEHGDLQLSIQAVKALDAEQRWPDRVMGVLKHGQQLRSQVRAAKLYRDSVLQDLSVFWGCCGNPAAGAVLLSQCKAKLEALTQELDVLNTYESQLWEHIALTGPEIAVALRDVQLEVVAESEVSAELQELSMLLVLVQEQLSQHCAREVTHLHEQARQLAFCQELTKLTEALGSVADNGDGTSDQRQKLVQELDGAIKTLLEEKGAEDQQGNVPRILGLSTFDLHDGMLSASSNSSAAKSARLLRCSYWGGWTPSADAANEFLEVNFGVGGWAVAGISMQGRVPCSGKWQQTRDLLELALGTAAQCLQQAEKKTFLRPPVRFVHEASVALVQRAQQSTTRYCWALPDEYLAFADMSREKRVEFFEQLIQKTNAAWIDAGTAEKGVALILSPQDVTGGKNCKETNRMLQMLAYLAISAESKLEGGLSDIAPQWTTKWRMEYCREEGFDWQWYGAPEGGRIAEATVIEGNTDADSVKFFRLPAMLQATKLRFHPVAWNRHAAFRCEVHVSQMASLDSSRSDAMQRASQPLKANVTLLSRGIVELQKAWEKRQQAIEKEKVEKEKALKEMAEGSQQKSTALEQDLTDAKTELGDAKSELADAKSRVEYLETRAVNAETQLLKERAENERLTANVEQLNAEMPLAVTMAPQTTFDRESKEQLNEDHAELQDQVDELQGQLHVLSDERDVARRHVQELFTSLNSKDEALMAANTAREAMMKKLEDHLMNSQAFPSNQQEMGLLQGRLQAQLESHEHVVKRSEELQEEVMRLKLENQKLNSDKDRLSKKSDKLAHKRDTYKEKYKETEHDRRSLARDTEKMRDRVKDVYEKVSTTPTKSGTPSGTPRSPPSAAKSPEVQVPSEMARVSKHYTLGRCPGIPVTQWMQPREYGKHLGLSGDVPGSIDTLILDGLTPVFQFELPLPWEVHLHGDHLYFAHSGFDPAQTSWEHPMKPLHLDMVEAIRRAAQRRGTGQPRPDDVAKELQELIQKMVGKKELASFGTWEPVAGWSKTFQDIYSDAGIVQYRDRKSGDMRNDDPRLAVASYVGLSLTALRLVWDNFVGSASAGDAAAGRLELFPFGEDEAWNVAEQLASSVVREPRKSSSTRNLLAPD